jgi:CBS domain containing-hemolysin-like protein
MDPAWFALIGFLSLALGVSFFCSVLEAVILSITPSYIASQKGEFGSKLEELKRDVDKPLSAILTLNTFAHTIGAAGVGAAAQEIWGEGSLTIVSAIATLLILVGSEIIPKTIGAVHWRKLAQPVVMLTRWLTLLLAPLVWVCQFITRLLRRGEQASVLSRTDLSSVASLGHRHGLVRDHERRIIANLMHKDKLHAKEVMTPIDRLVALPANSPLKAIRQSSSAWHISRIPLFQDQPNNLVGYVLKDEILSELLSENGQKNLSLLMRPIIKVYAEDALVDLYRHLIDAHEHIAVVTDTNKKAIGIVTMEDLIEEVLGQDIVDESDRARGVLD